MNKILVFIAIIIPQFACSQTLHEYYNGTSDDFYEAYNAYLTAQSYTVGDVGPNENFTLTHIKVKLFANTGFQPGTITANIYAVDGSGRPTGSALASGTYTNTIPEGSANASWITISTSPAISQAIGTKYAVQLSAANYSVRWACNVSGNPYSGGWAMEYSGGWVDRSSSDMCFEIWGTADGGGEGSSIYPLVSVGGRTAEYSIRGRHARVKKTRSGGGGSTPAGSIFELNDRLHPGMNAYGISTAYIPSWDDRYIDSMATAGFRSVRIVSYEPINSTGLARVKQVVDRVLSLGMIPIYGQWDHSIMNGSGPTTENIADFVANCAYIADYFSEYADQDLIIELVNEPNNEAGMTASQWNSIIASSVSAIRSISPTRPIMVSPIYWGQVDGLNESGEFEPPVDDNIIVSLHYYHLREYVWQGTKTGAPEYREEWVGMNWHPVQPLIDDIEAYLQPLYDWMATHNYPVNIGEFGVTINATRDSRIRYLNYMTNYFAGKGISAIVWDWIQDYGMFSTSLNKADHGLVAAVTGGTAYPEWNYSSSTVYQSNFSTTNGWSGSSGVTVSTSGGELVATLSSAGSNPEDRYISHSVSLTQHTIYRVSFTVRSTRSWTIMTIGGPYVWELFTGITIGGYTKVYTFMFANTSTTTNINFQFGGSTATFYLSDFKIESITPTSPYP